MNLEQNLTPQPHHPAFSPTVRAVLQALVVSDNHYFEGQGFSTDTWSALYQLDGINEVLEWNNEGASADEVACMWLAQLRMLRSVHGFSSDVAPFAPDRDIDRLQPHVAPHDINPAILRALTSADMQLVEKNINAEIQDAGSLIRSLVLGFVPVDNTATVATLAARSAALTHGSEEAILASVATAVMMRNLLALQTSDQQEDLIQIALEATNKWFENLPLPQFPGDGLQVRSLLNESSSGTGSSTNHAETAYETLRRALANALIFDQGGDVQSTSEQHELHHSLQEHRIHLLTTAFIAASQPSPDSHNSKATKIPHLDLVWDNFCTQIGAVR